MVNLIGISGKIGSGKDTIGKIIIWLTSPEDRELWGNDVEAFLKTEPKGYEWEIRKFADKLKDIVCLLIGCTREQLEDADFKNKELGEEWWFTKRYGKIYTIPNHLEWRKVNQLELNYDNIVKPTVRYFLQYLATELLRDQLHPNVHINALFVDYKENVHYMCDRCMTLNIRPSELLEIESRFKEQGYMENEFVCPNCKGKEDEGAITKVINDNPSRWIITDLRFPNEAKAIKERGGIVVRVERPLVQINEYNTGRKEVTPVESHPSETALDHFEETGQWDHMIHNDGTIKDLIEQVQKMLIKYKIL